MQNLNDSFRVNLKKIRTEKGFTQATLGKKINSTGQVISNLERGYTKTITASDLNKLCSALMCSPNDLIPGTHPTTQLTAKDEKDVSKKLDELKEMLESQDALMFSGGEMDDKTRELLLASLESTIRQSKILAKEKFTPNKYKK